ADLSRTTASALSSLVAVATTFAQQKVTLARPESPRPFGQRGWVRGHLPPPPSRGREGRGGGGRHGLHDRDLFAVLAGLALDRFEPSATAAHNDGGLPIYCCTYS